ncbi:hypothetical protein [Streptomyces sp. NPDC005970]|uniref:hypothetical protein n=1 Tax=Streptomyces sp. NPDC005970 TaxID=3156723 RepID=UPI0033EB6D01
MIRRTLTVRNALARTRTVTSWSTVLRHTTMELLRSTTRTMSIQRSRTGTQLGSHSPSRAARSAVASSSTSFATGEGEVRRSGRSARDRARSAVGGRRRPGRGRAGPARTVR